MPVRSKSETCAALGPTLIDQRSASIYAGPASILRQVIKNAHDAYLALAPGLLEKEKVERAIVLSRERYPNGTGRLFIEDNGAGYSFKNFRRNGRLSNSPKPRSSRDVAPFRDLCSWALPAGSRLVIASATKGGARRSRLEMNTRLIHDRLRSHTSLDDILNDPQCISFSSEAWGKNDHGTTVEIECDGNPEVVNGFQLNCIYHQTDPKDKTLARILAETCPLPYATQGPAGKSIQKVYDRAGYIPAAIYLDGRSLERRLPPGLTAFHTQEIKVAGRIAAIAWYVEDPGGTAALDVQPAKHLVCGAGIQLVKHNTPVGPKNIFCDAAQREFLNCFLGEVHIVCEDLQPDAGGKDLRSGSARDAFIGELRKFHASLLERVRAKSRRLNLAR